VLDLRLIDRTVTRRHTAKKISFIYSFSFPFPFMCMGTIYIFAGYFPAAEYR
jgi:hypothetical protein